MSQRNLPLRRAVATVLAMSCAMAAPVVTAQETPAESAAVLGEIIVTAQKREQSLQDVPVVVTAISEQQLRDAGVKDIKELTLLTPGLTVTSTSSEASTTARIRGVGTVGDNPGLESSVGVVIDGVYRPRNGVSFGDLGEMERVEVLKGPQGTLFGKNTSAGVINVMSKKPSFDPSSTIEVSGGNFGAFDVSASLNGPIAGDAVAGRLFAAIRNREGLLDVNTAGGDRPKEDGDRDFYTVRGQLLFNLGDAADLRLVADVTERDEQCCAAVQVVHGGTAPLRVQQVAPDGQGVAQSPNPFARVAYANRGYGQFTKDRGVSAELNVDIGDMTLTSITAGRDWHSIRGQDTDFTTADIWYRLDNGNVFSRFRQLSQELRLAGDTDRLNWLVGVFYAKEKLNTGDELLYGNQWNAYLSRTLSGGLSPAVLAAWTALPTPFIPGTGLQDAYEQVAESYALFTNNSFEITDGLELTIGARYTSETKDLTSYHWNPNGTGSIACNRLIQNLAGTPAPGALQIDTANAALVGGVIGLGCGTWADPAFNNLTLQQEIDEGEVTGTAKLAYRFSDAVMTYASYARGYKAAGFNLDRERSLTVTPSTVNPGRLIVTTQADSDKSFPAEFVDSYELGVKTTLADGAVLLNAAAFYQVFEDFQLNTFLGTSFVVTAIKEVESQGIDLDLIYRTDFGFGIQAGVTWSETEITDYGTASNVVVANRKDDILGFAPKWSASLALSHREEFGDYAFRASVGAKYNSEYNTGSNLDPRKIQDSYTLVNARIGFGSADDMWAVELWGQNVTDEEYVQVAFDAPLQTGTIDAFLGAQRLYGASVILRF